MTDKTETAILAGGCFWGVQDLIRKRPGVISTRVGYTGGDTPNATYRNHGSHAEAIEITFDPDQISYRDLLEFFFQIHDPTTKNRQGNDVGTSYRSAIFYLSDEQRAVAEDTIADVDASGLWPGKVVTEVEPAGPFWEAEPEHQDYLEHYPNGYTCHFVRPELEAAPSQQLGRRFRRQLRAHLTLPGAVSSYVVTSEPTATSPELRAIMDERHQLLNLAYRLLGSVVEAEDVVQETYARWYDRPQSERDSIENPAAWLTRVAGRIALDQLRSARVRREQYVGEWVPEPLPEDTDWLDRSSVATTADPADRVTLDESVHMAFLIVLESMTPAERVAFVLHDVFRYPFPEVAEIVGRSPAACRQLATSARRRVRATQVPVTPDAQRSTVVKDFKRAWEAQDIDALVGLLDPDATVIADGGGIARAALVPVRGREQIAQLFMLIGRQDPPLTLVERTVNGQPGLVAQQAGVTVTVMSFDVVGDRIAHIWSVRNPDKLRPWGAS